METNRRNATGRWEFVRLLAGRRENSKRTLQAHQACTGRLVDRMGSTFNLRRHENTLHAVATTAFLGWSLTVRALVVTVFMAAASRRVQVIRRWSRYVPMRMMPAAPYQQVIEHDRHCQIVDDSLHRAISLAEWRTHYYTKSTNPIRPKPHSGGGPESVRLDYRTFRLDRTGQSPSPGIGTWGGRLFFDLSGGQFSNR